MNVCARPFLSKIASNFANPDHVYSFLLEITKHDVCLAGGAVLYAMHDRTNSSSQQQQISDHQNQRFPLKDLDLFMLSPTKRERRQKFIKLLEYIRTVFPDCQMYAIYTTKVNNQPFCVPLVNVFLDPEHDVIPLQIIGGWGFRNSYMSAEQHLYTSYEQVLAGFSEDYVECVIYDERLSVTPDCLFALETNFVRSCHFSSTERQLRALQKGFVSPFMGNQDYMIPCKYEVFCSMNQYFFTTTTSTTNSNPLCILPKYKTVELKELDSVVFYHDTEQDERTNYPPRHKTQTMMIVRLSPFKNFQIADQTICMTSREIKHNQISEVNWLTTSLIVDTLTTWPLTNNKSFMIDPSSPWSQWIARVYFPKDKNIVFEHGKRISFGKYLLPAVRVKLCVEQPRLVINSFPIPLFKRDWAEKYGDIAHMNTWIDQQNTRERHFHFALQVIEVLTNNASTHILPMMPKYNVCTSELSAVEDVCRILSGVEDMNFFGERMMGDKDTPLPLLVLVCIVLKHTSFLFSDVVAYTGYEPFVSRTYNVVDASYL